MTAPHRAARLWVAVAVATWGRLCVGGAADATVPAETLLPLPGEGFVPHRHRRATQLRLVSLFRQGWILILVALLNHHRLPIGRFMPEPWPCAEMRELKLRVNHNVPLAA